LRHRQCFFGRRFFARGLFAACFHFLFHKVTRST
jgi:hypothetical protein